MGGDGSTVLRVTFAFVLATPGGVSSVLFLVFWSSSGYSCQVLCDWKLKSKGRLLWIAVTAEGFWRSRPAATIITASNSIEQV